MNFRENETPTKLRGGYYTDPEIASFLTRWVLEIQPQNILEPSCGDGVFIESIALSRHRFLSSFKGFEIEPLEAEKARKRGSALNGRVEIHTGDFLKWSLSQLLQPPSFDAVLGNPPFIRYQYLDTELQTRAKKIFEFFHLPFTMHTNAWVTFVILSIAHLRSGGRLAMVVPSEILHIPHAQALRTFLATQCSRVLIFDPQELWFKNVLQGAVLLLAQKKLSSNSKFLGVGIVPTRTRTFLQENASIYFEKAQFANGKNLTGKWMRALLTSRERNLLDDISQRQNVFRFHQVGSADVGIVTGANNFFLVPDSIVSKYGLNKWAHPMFGRSEHCPGVIYDQRQHQENARLAYPTNFLWLKDAEVALSKDALEYIRLGETQKLHTRYKCRIRKTWYTVPSVYATKIGMLKRAHDTPRLIYNRLKAYTTDTAYRINTKGCAPEKLIYCFLNALTALSAELEGRHYGGGVLELVPTEIEKLIVPLPSSIRPEIRKLDTLVRQLSMENVLEQQNKKVLGTLGLSKSDQDQLLGAWLRLKNRRQRLSDGEETSQSQS